VNTLSATSETLSSVVLAPLDRVRSVALVLGFSLLTALAAQVVIPVPPVPITAQTFAVLLTGAVLGSRLGALAMIAYLIEGASGLPVFQSGHGGAHYLLFSPTAGYLWSYPAAAFLTGLLAERGWDKRFTTAAAAMTLGSLVILLTGWAWLARYTTPTEAFHFGVTRFLVGDAVKIMLAAAVLPTGWKLMRRRASHEN